MGQVVLVTGGASGIGGAVADLLYRRAWSVVVLDSAPSKFSTIAADVRSTQDVDSFLKWIKTHYGQLDLLVTCAAVHSAKRVDDTTDEEYARLADINMMGTFRCIRAAMPLLKKCGGSIVTIGSDAALIADRESPLYCASKAWVVMLTKALALDYQQTGVRVNCVCPGQTDTPFLRNAFNNDAAAIEACAKVNPMGRLARPEEIAEAVVFLSENQYANGAILNMDGGYSWQPTQEPPK